MLEELIHLDENILIYLNNLGNTTWDRFWIILTNKRSQIPFYFVLLFLLVKSFGWKKTGLMLISVAFMILVTDQTCNFFKYYIMRPRPCRVEGLVEKIRFISHSCGPYGYFSGHSANSMALAFFLGNMFREKYRYMLIGLIIWSFIIGYSRIYVGVHYPGDILTGFVFGAIIGYTFYRTHSFLVKKYLNI